MPIASPLNVLLLGCVCAAGCGDTNAFHYDYHGVLRMPDGRPAAGAKIFATDSEGLRLFDTDEARWDHWRYWGTVTDKDGHFAGRFNGEDTYWKWLGILPVAPPAKELPGVYIAYNLRCEWYTAFVRMEENSQMHASEGARELDLFELTVGGRESSSRSP